MKYLEIDLTKEMKDLYTENQKILMKGTEEDKKQMERYSRFVDWIK